MRKLLALLAVLALSGCATRTVVKPVPVEVTKYVKATVPASLLVECRVYEPDPACWRDQHREFCNDQLLYVRSAYRKELAMCDADKTELRKLLQPKGGGK